MMGMFVIGSLIQRWVSITFTPVVSTVKQQEGAYIDWDKLPKGIAGVKAVSYTHLDVYKRQPSHQYQSRYR